ncbi:phage terminase small subunit P27 family [Enterococcus casseliflavus]|uniref:phage terminase small subunit P27 family n=1 Tax=Enterococcus casseliflavus TaxID=37734 RepID=UPI0039A5921D
MGRKFKFADVSNKHYTQDEIENKKAQEASLSTFEPLNFEDVPKHLDTDGKKEWKRLAFFVSDLPISELDRTTIENICMYTSLIKKAQKELKKQELIAENNKINPLITLINQASKELRALASMSGMSIDSRLRIANPTRESEPDDPFGDMLNRADKNA